MKEILSLENKTVKFANSLKEKKYRDSHKVFLAEGFKIILEALKAGLSLRELFIYDPENNEAQLDELKSFINEGFEDIFNINEKVLKKISTTDSPQSFVAIFQKKENVSEIEFSELNLYCDRIQDPGNLGSMIRTALAANCKTIFCENCVDIYNPKLLRASAGSVFHTNIITTSIQKLKKLNSDKNLIFVATNPRAKLNYTEFKSESDQNCVLMMGNEGHGLSGQAFAAADVQVKIPINPQVESLNVLAASTLLLFEMQKKLCTT